NSGCIRHLSAITFSRLAHSGKLVSPAQALVQSSQLLKPADFVDPNVALLFHIRSLEPESAVRIVEFLGALACNPLRTELGEKTVNLVKADAIAARVGAATGGVFDAAAGNNFDHEFRDL